MNKNLKIVLPILLVSSSVFVLFQIKEDSNISIPTNYNSNDVQNQKFDSFITPTPFQKLSIISNRCIGCGKCTRIDSIHFEMVNKVAKVISYNNLNSSNLAMAINNCPVQAITLK